ncbi:type II secretion system protein [uncultured Clostridium sp.]|uniref:type II secretion system protein n=1 Tax=uncultured Clostridium sp. TaxID=59620 RepID=UPI0026045721|nr:type II secretion system protein [uncultured Clostridium sp.]
MKKRKGFTLIETGAVITITILLFGLGGVSYGAYSDYKDEIIEREFLNNLYNLINTGRDLCIETELGGEIEFNSKEQIIQFEINSKKDLTKIIKVPKEVRYNTPLLKIKSNGDLPACSIEWEGRKSKNKYKLTIQVGISTVRIYVNEKIQEG